MELILRKLGLFYIVCVLIVFGIYAPQEQLVIWKEEPNHVSSVKP